MIMAKFVDKYKKIYRFMALTKNCSNYHVDFDSQQEGIDYINQLNDSKIEWYGLYEVDSVNDKLKTIISKRVIPYDDTITVTKIKKEKLDKQTKTQKVK